MTEKLKFTVGYSKTINIGNYESEKYSLSEDYYTEEITVEEAFAKVKNAVERMMYGIPPALDYPRKEHEGL